MRRVWQLRWSFPAAAAVIRAVAHATDVLPDMDIISNNGINIGYNGINHIHSGYYHINQLYTLVLIVDITLTIIPVSSQFYTIVLGSSGSTYMVYGMIWYTHLRSSWCHIPYVYHTLLIHSGKVEQNNEGTSHIIASVSVNYVYAYL